MASLSKEMRSKRDIKRMPSLLIVDSDVGNIGLYKSILSIEYEMDNVYDISAARNKLEEKKYDAIILDDNFQEEEIIAFLQEANKINVGQVVCLITDKRESTFVVKALCNGVYRLIDKPFSRDGLTDAIYEELKRKRGANIKKQILIVDEDINLLQEMKKHLEESYNVILMNCCDSSLKYIRKHHPNLVIVDANMVDAYGAKINDDAEDNKEEKSVSLLFMTDNPNEECVLKCAQFKPEGFLVKPIDMVQLEAYIERIFLMETYSRSKN